MGTQSAGHLTRLNESITLPPAYESTPDKQRVDKFPEFHPITANELSDALLIRITDVASRRIDSLYQNLSRMDLDSSVGYAYDRWQKALGAYRRLQFVDRTQIYINIKEWERRVEVCQANVKVLKETYDQSVGLNQEIDELRGEAKAHLSEFEGRAEQVVDGQVSIMELLTYFSFAASAITNIADQIVALKAQFDNSSAKAAFRGEKKLLPSSHLLAKLRLKHLVIRSPLIIQRAIFCIHFFIAIKCLCVKNFYLHCLHFTHQQKYSLHRSDE